MGCELEPVTAISRLLVEIRFPAEPLTHLGWSDPTVGPERPALVPEEDATAARLLTIIAAGHRVRFYSAGDSAITAILQRRPAFAFLYPHQHPLGGSDHRILLEFPGTPA